jgi:putative ABC transport system permease protein
MSRFTTTLREIAARMRGLFEKRHIDADLEDEFAAHLDLLTEENIRRGMSREAARYAARREFGGVEQIKELYRERRGLPMLETFLQDVRFGGRMLWKNPGFTAVAVLALALGIGANAAIFSLVNAVLIRPLPFKDPNRLVMLWEGLPEIGLAQLGFEAPDFRVFQGAQKSFEEIGAFQSKEVDISGFGEPEHIKAARLSASVFPMLGVQPLVGRTFADDEDAPGKNVAVVSYGLWQRRYGGDAGIVGRTVDVDRQPYTVIGVMPKTFAFPLRGPRINNESADLWIPMAFTSAELKIWGVLYNTSVLARLKSGITLAQARAECDALARPILASYPPSLMLKDSKDALTLPTIPLKITAVPLHEEVAGSVRSLLLIVMSAVSLVLLIACANVATLFISRAISRQKEIAIRASLGATRLRLVRQMLTESFLLTLMGGAVGLLLALVAKVFLLSLVPPGVALPADVSLDAGTMAFAFGISCVAALLTGTAPALQMSGGAVQLALQDGGRSTTPGRARNRLQGVFVVVEFALALMLLVGSGLLIRSFGEILKTKPGFNSYHVLTFGIPLPYHAYNKATRIRQFYDELLRDTSQLPGVEFVGLSNDLPLNGHLAATLEVEGITGEHGVIPQSTMQSLISGNYFDVMKIPLLQGRYFVPEDHAGSQPVTIVSQSVARKYWPDGSALGKHIRWGGPVPWQTIVGIVGDVNDKPLGQPVDAHAYMPYAQMYDAAVETPMMSDFRNLNFAARTKADPAALATTMIQKVRSLDPDLVITNMRTMTETISDSVSGPRFNTLLLGIFAGIALLLASIGIYGVLAYVVTQQTHEIGIRLALGAEPLRVFALVLGRGARLAAIGAAIGVAGSIVLTRLMKELLYGISPTDPSTFFAVVALLVFVALAACYIPARRAMRVDPMTALRHE